jgi:hypothetical protein
MKKCKISLSLCPYLLADYTNKLKEIPEFEDYQKKKSRLSGTQP